MQSQSAPNCSPPSNALIAARDFFYVSNLLSMMRIGLTPFLFYCIFYGHQFAALGIGGLAILSDALDGYFARRLNQQTNLGKILDPVADKIAIAAVILAIVLSNPGFPLWALGIVVARDVLIVIVNIVLFRRTQIIARSNLWGKGTTFFLSIALMLYILERQVSMPLSLPFYVLCVGLVLSLISSWSYSRLLLRMLQQSEPRHQKAM
ncbi:MAG: CDP-alcohol phosphatidyltransferase family protein [Candidatus Poribacteria bacterium]|nr:CDP-alcohol phosphatidyltransferase family protein [Candidatus Poribacteria bacterium]